MAAAAQPELARDLKLSHATAIVVGTIIGSGIFLVPSEMMQAAGSSGLVYLAWIAGGLISFAGAQTYAELGAMKPQTAGEYVFIRDAYGPLVGFLYGWTYFVLAMPATLATIAVGFVRILGTFSPLAFLPRAVIHTPITITWAQLVAIAAIAVIAVINYIGAEPAGNFQLFTTLLKVATILAVGVVGFSYAHGSWHNYATSHSHAIGGMAGFMAALLAALWAYDGWNLVTTMSAEIRDPQRTLPIALTFGVAAVAFLYIAVNAAVQYVLPAEAIARSPRPASDAAALALGALGAGIVSAAMAISMFTCLNGNLMTAARIPFALARDRYFFKGLAKVHPVFRTPSTAILVQAALGMVLVLVAETFQELFSLTLFPEYVFYMLATASVFVFRWREPDAPRPYRTWGYPFLPALFIVASAMLLYYSFKANVKDSLGEIAVILLGLPFYLHFRKRS